MLYMRASVIGIIVQPPNMLLSSFWRESKPAVGYCDPVFGSMSTYLIAVEFLRSCLKNGQNSISEKSSWFQCIVELISRYNVKSIIGADTLYSSESLSFLELQQVFQRLFRIVKNMGSPKPLHSSRNSCSAIQGWNIHSLNSSSIAKECHIAN